MAWSRCSDTVAAARNRIILSFFSLSNRGTVLLHSHRSQAGIFKINCFGFISQSLVPSMSLPFKAEYTSSSFNHAVLTWSFTPITVDNCTVIKLSSPAQRVWLCTEVLKNILERYRTALDVRKRRPSYSAHVLPVLLLAEGRHPPTHFTHQSEYPGLWVD